MMRWNDNRVLELFNIELPILQAPMAGASTPEMAVAVSEAGGLGSIPSAQYSAEQLLEIMASIRDRTRRPINVNFFAHTMPDPDPARDMRWRAKLAPYYVEMGLDPACPLPVTGRKPFDEAFCEVVEAYRPEVVSFHFGLPPADLLDRVKATGAKIVSSATTVAEAVWLEEHGVDAVIAMGFEAGGHRGNFLDMDMATQVGTMALVPQVVDAVRIPVIAAGGISDGRGMAAALILGAAAVQCGTAYLFSPEAKIPAVHRAALLNARDDNTAITNVFTGRPARGVMNRVMREVGPLSDLAPEFPTAGSALAPLRSNREPAGVDDFTNLWSGQAAKLAEHLPAGELTVSLARAAQKALAWA
ncbi:nitronate monooxygenase family protein [Sinorhizobium sp. 8-89]|uniref:NAD(P)H-dependent flavin oxidoreductase n=1 Tax=Sinorhizobium sp. 7-81 TaxID=3049087 RepID=UPI0024C20E1F|nr:nitronate monooxygenase family protein [Sinorhizobium sp. 7-81]MDK1386471.1 nitronate monooxygenase family protein [Sinorhizobium sp. 7-81]